MPIHDHTPSSLGRGFLWGGVALGLLLVALLYTHGLGLWVASPKPEPLPPLVRQGDRISIPEGSPLRNRLTVMPVSVQPVNDRLVLPAVVESDPARTASVMRMGAIRRLVMLRLPAASPHLVTGVKLAVAYSVIGIVAGEFILATAGIGKRIAFGYQDFDNRTMYGMLLLLLLAVMAVNGALSHWEKRLHLRFGQS